MTTTNMVLRVAIFVLVFSAVIGGAIPPQQITWTQAILPSVAQGYLYKLYVTEESGIKKVVPLSSVLCGPASNGASACSTVLPVEANAAIITGNNSQLTATNPTTNQESPLSTTFVGNQGCIFRDNLFAVTKRTSATSNKQNLNALLNEFKAAKFKHISTNQTRGNQYVVTEECAGVIIH